MSLTMAARRRFRRSRKMEQALEVLTMHEAPVDAMALARAIRMSPGRLLNMMRGGGEYKRDDSPRKLGLVREATGLGMPTFEITAKGRASLEVVRSLRASNVPI